VKLYLTSGEAPAPGSCGCAKVRFVAVADSATTTDDERSDLTLTRLVGSSMVGGQLQKCATPSNASYGYVISTYSFFAMTALAYASIRSVHVGYSCRAEFHPNYSQVSSYSRHTGVYE
jgi:hypothetical protein